MNKNLRNTLSLFSMDLGMKLLGFLAAAYLARILGKSGFGAINVGQSVFNYASVLATGGLVAIGTRKIAANPEINITGEIFFGRLSLAILVFIIGSSLTLIFSGFNETSYIIIAYLLSLFPIAFLLEWFFVGIQKMEKVAYARIMGTAFYLLLVAILVHEPNDAVLTGIAYTIGTIVTAALFIFFYKKSGYLFHFKRSSKSFISILKESFPLSIASYISQFLSAFPVIYIASLYGNSEAGIFSAGIKMIGLFLMFDRIFVTIFLPKITNVISSIESELENIFNTVLKINVFFTLIASVFLFLFSDLIITKAFGRDYIEASFIFRVLLVYFVFTIIDSVFANTLIGLMKEKIYTMSLLIAMIIFLLLTFFLTPLMGMNAVVYSFALINVISLSCMIYFLKKNININILRTIAAPFLFTGILFLFLILSDLPLYAEILIVVIIFIPLLTLLLKFGKEEVNFIKRIFI